MQVSTTPWLIGSKLNDGTLTVLDGDNCIVATVQPAPFHNGGSTEDRQEANAQMIEMAPKMLEALRTIASQSLGDDWTAEQAIQFAKQHAKEIIAQVTKPQFYFCGICGEWHRVGFDSDCRDDTSRFTYDQLDAKYGVGGWEEVAQP